ncbi:bifunctional DNA primase/polymerase [Caldisericum sp.]|uniref:bifunctional DNA primase/polymerase n=1 Tax=Caldisericum sp. TaxID=2499687 RepID=UPI003D0B1E2F
MRQNRLKELLVYAEFYHDAGFSVIPLQARRKQPLISWQEYQERIATLEEIHSWFKHWKNLNIGIVTGKVSNIIVLDIDGEKGWSVIREKNLKLPNTWKVQTGKGAHYYFRYPGWKVSSFTQLLPGIDLRGDGGYVVAPPSMHPSGEIYQWDNELKGELAEAPEWLLELILNKDIKDSSICIQKSLITKNFCISDTVHHGFNVRKPIIPTRDFCIKDTVRRLDDVFKRFRELEEREDFLDFVFEIGLGEKVGRDMLCVLHQEDHPSASVFKSNVSGRYLYKDFHTSKTYSILDLLNEYYFNSNEKLKEVFKACFAKYLIQAFPMEEETKKIYKLLRSRDENLAKTYFLIASLNTNETIDQQFLSVRDLARVLKLSNITHANRLLNYLCLIDVIDKKTRGNRKAYGYVTKEVNLFNLLSEIERTKNINIYKLSKTVAMKYFPQKKVKEIYMRKSSAGIKV